jgi:hypothetical protein
MIPTSIAIGIFICLVVITIILVIFAPKKKKFFNDVYPFLSNDAFGGSATFKLFKKDVKNTNIKWITYPDSQLWKQDNDLLIYPLFMYDLKKKKDYLYTEFMDNCPNIFNFIRNIPISVKCSFIAKLPPNTMLKQHSTWKSLANSTLRCIFPIKCSKELEYCGVWVDGESKKFTSKKWLVFDHSQKWMMYNKDDSECLFVIIDIQRPSFISKGISETKDLL